MTKFCVMANTSELLSVTQVARELNLSRRAVVHRINAGTITAEKLGDGHTSAYFITRVEVERVKAGEAA